MDEAAVAARRMWTLFEPVHVASTYFGAEALAAFEQAGLRGFWRGYFAGRTAPVGPVGAAPVVATFFNFAPAMVARALPAVWDLITPAAALEVRQAGAVASLRRLLGLADDDDVPEPVGTGGGPAGGRGRHRRIWAGRVLGAANLALPVPGDPLARLWHAATVLREHRGDGHVAALVAADIDGAEALALRAGVDEAADGDQAADGGHAVVRTGWTSAQMRSRCAAGQMSSGMPPRPGLTGRGLLLPGGMASSAGQELHREIEHATDVAAARPWAALPAGRTDQLSGLLLPIARACAATLPYPNPVGVPAPAAS